MQAAESDSLSEELNICAPTDNDASNDDGTLQQRSADPASSISPTSLRRSSRVSALRAQKKESDCGAQGNMVENHDGETTGVAPGDAAAIHRQHADDEAEEAGGADDEGVDDDHVVEATDAIAEIAVSKKKLKRKLADTEELDQYDAKFGIRLDPHGDVVVMSEGSEISSLDTGDVSRLREECGGAVKREVSDEVLAQREVQIRELEAALRLEEAKLTMLKKIRQNQQQNYNREPHKRLSAAAIAQNSAGRNAYRPVVASGTAGTLHQNAGAKMNGVHGGGYAGKAQSKSTHAASAAGGGGSAAANASQSVAAALASGTLSPQHQQLLQSLLAKVNNNPQQFAQLIRQLTPAHITALLQQQQQQQATAQQQAAAQQQQQQVAAAAAAAAAAKTAVAQAAKAKEVAQNNVQKIAAARQQLRHHLEQQLFQLPTPKSTLSELPFLPNANQPDFCALLGLDLTVQRVLKDKSVFRRAEFPPYVCEECGTDFTPAWKAIAGEEENYHLYCEECVKEAQKRKIRQDYMALLKRAFARVQEQEKEFERQAVAGKFSDPVPTVPAATVTNHQYASSLATTNVTASAAQRNVPSPLASSTPSKSASAGNTMQQATAAATMGSQSGGGVTKQTSAASGQRANKKRVSHNGSGGGGGSASSSANAAAGLLNASGLGSSPQLQQRLMAQWMMSQMGTNPLMATMFQNPMLLQQFWQLMTSQRLPQGGSGGGSTGNGSSNQNQMPIAAALLAAAQSAQQQQNSSGGGTQKSSSSSAAVNSGGSSDGSGVNPMLLALRQLSSSSGGLMNNPQLMHAFQQAQLAHQMRDYASSSSKVKGGSGKK